MTGYFVSSGSVELVLVVMNGNCGLYAFYEHSGARSIRLAGADMSAYFSYTYANGTFTYTTKSSYVGIKIIH